MDKLEYIPVDMVAYIMFNSYFIINTLDELYCITSSITHIEILGEFSIDTFPSSSLTHLTFAYNSSFNQSVDSLPSSLTHLTFASQFNQSSI